MQGLAAISNTGESICFRYPHPISLAASAQPVYVFKDRKQTVLLTMHGGLNN